MTLQYDLALECEAPCRKKFIAGKLPISTFHLMEKKCALNDLNQYETGKGDYPQVKQAYTDSISWG